MIFLLDSAAFYVQSLDAWNETKCASSRISLTSLTASTSEYVVGLLEVLACSLAYGQSLLTIKDWRWKVSLKFGS